MLKWLQIGATNRPEQRPLIAVSMQVANVTELKDYVADNAYQAADVLEWRIDAWQDFATLTDMLIETTIQTCGKPIILTWRTITEGGHKTFERPTYHRLYQTAIKAGVAAVDIEVAILDDMTDLVDLAQKQGITIIGSRHDWVFPKNVTTRMTSLLSAPVDVIKYVALVESREQGQLILDSTRTLAALTDKPLITMGMGAAGSFTRLEGFMYGSQLTFAQLGQASAPGQVALPDVVRYFGD